MMQQFLVLLILLAGALGSDILLPKYQNPYDVTIRTTELVDKSRIDQDDPKKGFRRIMISVFSPVRHADPKCKSRDVLDAPADTYSAYIYQYTNVSINFKRFYLPYCSFDVTYGPPTHYKETKDGTEKPGKLPLLFFSPGLTVSRLYYNAINSALASSGFLVVSVDHPYSVDVVQYPDNTTAVMKDVGDPDEAYDNKTLSIRTKDVLFTLDRLTQNSTLRKLVFPESQPLNLSRVAMLGHSFGGATAAGANYEDKRFKAGLDLDGALYGPVLDHGLSKPFILWQREAGHNRSNDESWAAIWPRLRGFRRNLSLAKSQHLTFSDLRLLADLYGLRGGILDEYLGAIVGKRDVEILRAYATDFFNFALLGKKKELVERPNRKYPEVSFIP